MMRQDPKGKGMVANNYAQKDKIPDDGEPKGEKSLDSRTKKKEGKKKCVKKIVYYESDTSTS
jgi:hypothetical protein